MTTLRRLVDALAANDWQCSRCGRWFRSGKPSQTCPKCSRS